MKTLSRVFDISSQSKLKLRRKQRNKISKIYANEGRFQTTVTVLISFVLTRRIINEFEKKYYLMLDLGISRGQTVVSYNIFQKTSLSIEMIF